MATAAQILNLANGSGNNEYNLGLGYDSGHTDITPSSLYGGFSDSYYFFPKPDNSAVVFRMKVTGGRTSSNTKYPRCELREMDVSNTGSNDPKAAWNGSSGTHWMRGKTKIVHVPQMKPWICFAQIHNGGSDVIRLQTEGTSPTALKLVARHTPPGGSEVVTTIQSSYTLGQVIDWKIECISGTIKVYLGGVVKYTGSGAYTGCYFKAGLYLQSSVNNVNNTENGDTSQYGEIEVYDFMTWHTGQPTPAATYFEVNGGGGGGSNVPTSVNAGFDATLNSGTAFSRTAIEAGSAAITSRKWVVQSAPAGVGGGSSTPEVIVGQTTKMTESFTAALSSTLWSSVQTNSYDGSASGYGTGSDYRLKVNYNAGTGHTSVLRTEVHDGDTAVGSHERAEISSFGKSWNDHENEECWYEFDVKFGDPTWSPSYSGSDDWLIFFQWHQVNDDGSPPLALSVHNDNKVYVEREPDTDFEFMGPVWTVRPGVWEHVVVHIKWSPNSSIGFIQIHLNGTEVLPKTFRKTMYQNDRTDPYYVKMGQYRRVNISGTTIVQHDNIRVSTTPPTTGSSGGGTSIVGTQIGSAAALTWTPPAVGAYTLRYTVTTAQGTFFDDVVVNVVTPGSGGGSTTNSTVGKTSAGASFSASSTVKAAVSKFTATANGKIKTGHAHAWLDSTGSVATKLCVYANNAGAVGAKLCESDLKTLTNTTDVLQDYVFSGANQADVVNGTDYWVGLAWNDPGTPSLNLGRDSTASLRQEVQGFTWPTLPDPYGAPTAQSGPVAVWVDTELVTGDTYTSPTFIGMTSGNDTSSSLILTPPAGLASGDHQMIVVDLATVNETFPSTPAGFVEAGKFSYSSVNDGGDTWQGAIYISNNSTVTGDVTIPKGGTRLMQAHRLAWRGGPGFDLETDVLRQATDGTTITLPDMFGRTGDVIVSGAINDRGGTTATTFSTPSGWTERVNANSTSSFPDKLNIGVWQIARSTDGTQTGSFTISPSDDPAVFSIRLQRITTPGSGSGATPGAAPAFVAVGSSKSGTSAAITMDGISAQAGQMDVIAILSAGAETMTDVPSGWQLMDTIQGAGPTGAGGGPYTGWLYYNTEGAGTASFTKSGTRFWHAVRGVWSGQHVLGEHKVYAEASGSGTTSHSIPVVVAINPNSRIVGICMQDLQVTDPGPYEPPAAWVERYDATKSASDEREAITIADFVAATPGQISGAFSGTAADEAIVFAFVLEAPPPTGGGGTSGTKLQAAQAILDRLQSPLAGGDFFEDWTYTGMPAVVAEWNDELLAEYEAATGPYAFPDDIDSGQVQGWLQSFIEANSGGDGGTSGPEGSPTISAGADATVAVNATFTRTATEEDNGSVITSRLWTIVSGPAQVGSTMSVTPALSWQFTTPGTYVVAYQSANALGTSVDTIVVTVTASGSAAAAWRRTNGWFGLQR